MLCNRINSCTCSYSLLTIVTECITCVTRSTSSFLSIDNFCIYVIVRINCCLCTGSNLFAALCAICVTGITLSDTCCSLSVFNLCCCMVTFCSNMNVLAKYSHLTRTRILSTSTCIVTSICTKVRSISCVILIHYTI